MDETSLQANLQEYLISHIKEGVEQARNGQFATEEEVRAVLEKWLR